jgi:hypothetical protein
MIHRALASDWSILIKEPIRTLVTIGAAYLLLLLPKTVYTSVEGIALKVVRLQKKTVKIEIQKS